MRCPKGKNCESKCGDNTYFNLADQGSSTCKYFKLPALGEEGRSRYKLDQYQWLCKNNHVNEGVEDGKKAPPCKECEETIENKIHAHLSSRLTDLGLDAGNGVAEMFQKSGQPASIPFDQFLRILFASHGQQGSGIRRQPGVYAKYPCANQCSRPSVDLKDAFPPLREKEIQVSRVAALMTVLSSSRNPAVSFNPAIFSRNIKLENLLTYLWCDLALLVGLNQELWNKYHSLVPLTIWNCSNPIIFGKMQALGMKVGSLKENTKLAPCALSWFKADSARSNTARFGDLTTAIQISQVRRKIRTASPGRDDPSLDEVVEVLDLNAAVLPQSYSRDELWRTFGPQTLQEACSFVGRVVETSTEKKITRVKSVQQILMKTARDTLRKRGVVEFECSDSETSEAEPQGSVDTRTRKRKRSGHEVPRPNLTRGRGSRGTNRVSPAVRGQNNSRAAFRGDRPQSKRSRGSNRARGNSNPFNRRERSPPRTFRCRQCRKAVDRYDYYCSGCGSSQN